MNITVNMLWGYFMGFGRIQGCRIATDMYGVSRGFGYITYESRDEAAAAIADMNGKQLGSRRVVVTENRPRNSRGHRLFIKLGKRHESFQRHADADNVSEDNKSNDKGDIKWSSKGDTKGGGAKKDLAGDATSDASTDDSQNATRDDSKASEDRESVPDGETVGEKEVEEVLKNYSSFDSISFPKDPTGKSRGFAFATLNSLEEAKRAIAEITEIGGLPATVDFATSSPSHSYPDSVVELASIGRGGHGVGSGTFGAEDVHSPLGRNGHYYYHRQRHGFANVNGNGNGGGQASSNTNLFVRPLAADVTESDLTTLFSTYGTVMSTKIMTNSSGQSRGFGFVSFEDSESATRAVSELDGTEFAGLTLSVAHALVRKQQQKRSYPGAHPHPTYGSARMPIVMPASQMQMPGYYYVPMEYSYDYAYGAPTGRPPAPIPIPGLDVEATLKLAPPSAASPVGNPAAHASGSTVASSAPTSTDTSPTREIDPALQHLGESLHPIVLQKPQIAGQLELANIITGMLLQQPVNDIIEWMKVPAVLDDMISQAFVAYQSWIQNSSVARVT